MPDSDAGRPALYDALVPDYLDFVRRHRGRRTTHQLEYCLGRFFGWLARSGIADLRSLTGQHVRDFVSSLKHFQPATIAVEASALRGFLSYLHLNRVLETDLANAVERPRIYRESQPPQVLDPKTVECLLAAVNRSTALGKRDYAMLLLAARYGLRPSDIRSLRFENVYWREHRIVLLQAGVSPVTIKDILGHAHLKTLEVYVQVDLEMKRRALESTPSPGNVGVPIHRHEPDLLRWLEQL